MSDISSEMTMHQIRKEIVKFNNDVTVQKLKTYYYKKTYPEILGVSRRELSHSSFLAWILNPIESHGVADFGVRRLIEILMASKFWPEKLYKARVFDDFITGNFKLNSSSVEREVSIDDAGRVDVLINLELSTLEYQSRLRIILENKVLSIEGKDQTRRYYDYFDSRRGDGVETLYVYLTPLSTLDLDKLDVDEQECEDKHFIQINYQTLVDSLLEPILEQPIDSETFFLVKKYIQSLGQPSMEEGAGFERGTIMAIGKEERELLHKFWTSNQKIIQAALYSLSSDPNLDEDDRDNARRAWSSINKSEKDRREIEIIYKDVLYKRIKKSDLGLETVRLLEVKGLIGDEIFDWLFNNKTCNHNLLKKKEDVTSTEEQYGRYRLKQEPELIYKGAGYYVARNWGIGNAEKFFEVVQRKFKDVRYNLVEPGS